jgi:succinate dehydrogenase/fumarate reductase flavoprotein subunit
VVLATGGFGQNNELKSRFFGPYGGEVLGRCCPANDGKGLLMGVEVGAKLSKGLGTFYGHLVVAPPAKIAYGDFMPWASTYHDPYSIVVNVDGLRYADEGVGTYGDQLAQQTVGQKYARALIIFDQAIYNKYCMSDPGNRQKSDRIKAAIEPGGRVVSAQTIQELATKVKPWGYDGDNIVKTLNEFNAAVDKGTTASLNPPKTSGRAWPVSNSQPVNNVLKIGTELPLWAMEAVPAASFCHGGLAVDAKCRVLHLRGYAIAGLFAATGTAGGFLNVYYIGGDSNKTNATTGFCAGESAAAYAKAE